MAAPTFAQIKEQFEAHALSLRPRLSIADGTLPDLIGGGIAAACDRIVAYAASGIRDSYLDGATGEALTILANDHWGVQRSPGAYATASITLTRSSGAAGGGTITAGSRFATVVDAVGTSRVFVSTANVVVVGAALTATVAVRAQDIGIAYNVAATSLTRVLDTLYDPLWTSSNAAAAAGGADADTDDQLRERVRGQSLAWRRGTAVALAYVAKQVAGVATATVVEDAYGLVAIYVADADGNSNAPLALAVSTAIEADGAAAGSAWFVQGGTVSSQTISVALTARTGVDTLALVTRVKAAIVARVNKLKHGETLYRDMIQQAARNAGGDELTLVNVVLPAANVTPTASQIIKTSTGLVTVV